MVNLTAMWHAAGKPEGRRPSNFKATADVKRRLAALDDVADGWYTVGRGAKAETYASDALGESYRLYLFTPKRGSTKSKTTGSTTGSTTGGYAGYTADDLQKAYNAGASNGYRSGYEAGLRDGASRTGSNAKLDAIRDYFNHCEKGRKAFAKRFHPDVNRGDANATSKMQFINNFFDDIERIFNRAA